MKKPNFILTVAAALAVAAFTIPSAQAQGVNFQSPASGHTINGAKIALTKGTYQTFSFGAGTGVTATVSGTTSGTIASMNYSATGQFATVTTTVTGTLDKKTIGKGKIGNKELLQLILNTTDKDALKGQSLVLASQLGGMLTSSTDTYLVGAADLKAVSTTIKYRPASENDGIGVSGYGYDEFYTERKTDKKNPAAQQVSGNGGVGVILGGTVATFSKSLISGVVKIDVDAYSAGDFKETWTQNQTNGVVIDSSKGSYRSKVSSLYISQQ
jgi:hypothetical protein